MKMLACCLFAILLATTPSSLTEQPNTGMRSGGLIVPSNPFLHRSTSITRCRIPASASAKAES